MSLLSVAVYASLKLLSLIEFLSRPLHGGNLRISLARTCGYLLLWPGMDPRPFFANSLNAVRPRWTEWATAIAKFFTGVALVTIAARYVSASPFFAGWIGAVGLLLMFHFGLFHILSVAWRHIGIAATPIMRTPLFAASLANFWGKRWNLAFRDFAHTFVFRPTHRRTGAAAATMLVFLASGLIHDLVISLPVKAGYGWPTAYFILQGAGLLFERTKFAARLGIGHGGIVSRVYTLLIVLAPIELLFHRPFIEDVIAPLLTATSDI